VNKGVYSPDGGDGKPDPIADCTVSASITFYVSLQIRPPS